MDHFLDKAKEKLDHAAEDFKRLAHKVEDKFDAEQHSHTHKGFLCHALHNTVHNQFHSFAPLRTQNVAKWYVDGCSYFWAMSEAIESAKETIWIMDWWLSPELFLRRPPSKWPAYRLDYLLKAAAQRGVKVNVMVYKEVENVLTLASVHTKHALEALDGNINVFRHPDHNLSGQDIASNFKNLFTKSHAVGGPQKDALERLHGFSDDVVLFWAHHEKLCLVDGKVAFMGGLDACFGRWDTNQHSIADAHPANVDETIFPGQDYNNARVLDFHDVQNFDNNKLDRTKDSRMGWSDLSISLQGLIIEDLQAHFVQRWNFIYDSKYSIGCNSRYKPLVLNLVTESSVTYHPDGTNKHFASVAEKLQGMHIHESEKESAPSAPNPSDALPSDEKEHHHHHLLDGLRSRFHQGFSSLGSRDVEHAVGAVDVQLVRSSSRWSHGIATEHSIANAYIDVIENSEHFIYIENQFFITATSHAQSPIKNKIGAVIAERIIKAAKAGEKYKAIVIMPSVPAFAGDLHDKSSLGTLAIMNLQYKSISRGGHSIIETIQEAGFDASKYIQFYNLRNYDRINTSAAMTQAEEKSGVSYEAARKEHDDLVGAGYDGEGENTEVKSGAPASQYEKYQHSASQVPNNLSKTADTVSSAYMLNGPPLSSIPWSPTSTTAEIDAFISEELYVHTKCLIADDRTAIIGSANLNDRSQLGNHDSEIAVVIQDPTNSIPSTMNDKPFPVSAFVSSLRRQLFRKHLGLLPPQDPSLPDQNYTSVSTEPNSYDWNSPQDSLVRDPLSTPFEDFWTSVARDNTAIFNKVFRPFPCDAVRTWQQYMDYHSIPALVSSSSSSSVATTSSNTNTQPPYQYGHVFKAGFPDGEEGLRMVKEELGRVRGSLVEMPLGFLADVRDLVTEGLGYNLLTEEIYT